MGEKIMIKYIGITIGPIVETLMLAKTPAMIWYASYTFSQLTNEICKEVNESFQNKIFSPHFNAKESKKYYDGIGRFNDRVIIETDNFEKVLACVTKAKNTIIGKLILDAKKICEDKDADKFKAYLEHFFCIHYYEFQIANDENPILKSGKFLDVLEQMPSFNLTTESNPLLRIFKGNEYTQNAAIKKSCFLKEAIKQGQSFNLLEKDGKRFRSIESIASHGKIIEKIDEKNDVKTDKIIDYYAIVQADGDSMGDYIATLKGDEKKIFSQKCFEYTEKSAEIINNYGGMTVYAGGDDLLFIAPLKNKEGSMTIFDLCNEIRKKYEEVIKSDGKTTVSFGIAIRYVRFPLYEAFESSRSALFGVAKSNGKNAIVIDFQKHSGQSSKLFIPFYEFEKFKKLFECLNDSDTAANEAVNSVIYILEKMSKMLETAMAIENKENSKKVIKNIFKNMFDAPAQKNSEKFIEKIAGLFCDYVDCKILVFDTTGYNVNKKMYDAINIKKDDHGYYKTVKTFESVLRLGKFYKEEKK